MVKEYLRLYNPSTPDWKDVSDISALLNFSNITSETTDVYLKANGIDQKYIAEMVECGFGFNVPALF